MTRSTGSPLPNTLSVWDVVSIVVGIVIGTSIFRTPAEVASSAGSPLLTLAVWVVGGIVSLIGVLCYAELASAYPHAGGDYHYFQRAFGDWMAFLFAWARLAVIQTGSIALLAFVFGDYASELWSMGTYSSSLYAAGAVIGLTGVNAAGVRLGKTTQRVLTVGTVLGLFVIIGAGIMHVPEASGIDWADIGGQPVSSGAFGTAMVFVLLSYGGWNEAAFVSGEMKNVQRDMVRALLISIGVITTLYVLVNWAYLSVLGISGMKETGAVGAALMRTTLGEWGAIGLSLLVVVADHPPFGLFVAHGWDCSR